MSDKLGVNLFVQMPGYEAYKDSGVRWIGEVPESWGILRFKYIATTDKGRLPKKIESTQNSQEPVYLSMDYLRGGEADQFVYDEVLNVVEDNEILLLWDGSNSGEFIKSRKGVISSTVAYVKTTGLIKSFAWYAYFLVERRLRSSTIGMGIPHVDGEQLSNTWVAIPSASEQTAIAKFLDQKTTQIDQAIAIKEKQIALLKERKQILIQNAVTRGLDPNVPMKDSGVEWIGEIPGHWDILANRALFQERVEPGTDGLPLLSVSIHTGVSSEELTDEDNIRGRVKIEDKSKYILVKKNDITFNMMRAWQGGIGCVKVDGMVSPAYIVAKPIIDLNSDYFEYQYRCPEFIQQMDRFSKGITDFRKRLYWNEFKQLMTVYPTKEEQDRIVEFIESKSKKTDKCIVLQQSQIRKLKEYKSTLINSAVTGKIKIPANEVSVI